jgi:hypothetical protein
MIYDQIVSTVTLIVDIGILVVLIIEFNYDKIQIEKKYFKKRQAKTKIAEKPVVAVVAP